MKKFGLLLLVLCTTLTLSSCAPTEYKNTINTLESYDGYSMTILGVGIFVDNDAQIMYIGSEQGAVNTHIIDFSGRTIYGYRNEMNATMEVVRYELDEKDVISTSGGDIILDIAEICKDNWDEGNVDLYLCNEDVIVSDLPQGIIDLLEELEMYPDDPDGFSVSIQSVYNGKEEMITQINIDYTRLFVEAMGRNPSYLDVTAIHISIAELENPSLRLPETFTESDEVLSFDDFLEN